MAVYFARSILDGQEHTALQIAQAMAKAEPDNPKNLAGDALVAERRRNAGKQAQPYAHTLWGIWVLYQGEDAPTNPFPEDGEKADPIPLFGSIKPQANGKTGLEFLTRGEA